MEENAGNRTMERLLKVTEKGEQGKVFRFILQTG